MIPSKYVPKQLEFLFFPYNRDFCPVYVVAVGTVPYKLIRLHSINEWNKSSLFNSFWASCIVSSPYMSLDMTTELKTRRNPCNTGVCFVPKKFQLGTCLDGLCQTILNFCHITSSVCSYRA